MPLTMGFIGKFYLVTAGAGAGLWALVLVLVPTSAVSISYYTRVIVAMWVREPDDQSVHAAVGDASGVVLAALTAFIIVFGEYPTPLIRLIERAVATLP